MKRVRLTMSQALVQFLDNQYIECDGVESKFVSGIFGIFGHGCVVGVGQALEQGGHNLKFYQGKNEQNMALAAVAYAKQMDRKAIIPCVSSIGPGATNMVTSCGCATEANELLEFDNGIKAIVMNLEEDNAGADRPGGYRCRLFGHATGCGGRGL